MHWDEILSPQFLKKSQLPYPRWCEKIYLASVQCGTNYFHPAIHIYSQLFWSQEENKTQINLLYQYQVIIYTIVEFIPLWVYLPQPSVYSIKINVHIVIVFLPTEDLLIKINWLIDWLSDWLIGLSPYSKLELAGESNNGCTERPYFVKMTNIFSSASSPRWQPYVCHIDECIHHFDKLRLINMTNLGQNYEYVRQNDEYIDR
jgi:hypothetical protein